MLISCKVFYPSELSGFFQASGDWVWTKSESPAVGRAFRMVGDLTCPIKLRIAGEPIKVSTVEVADSLWDRSFLPLDMP